jgi:hypothetical protein
LGTHWEPVGIKTLIKFLTIESESVGLIYEPAVPNL